MFLDYLLQSHLTECCDILAEGDTLRYYSLPIDFLKLFEQYPDIGDAVLCNPVETLISCDRDIVSAQEAILNDDHRRETLAGRRASVKRNVHARFYGLPVCPELHRTVFPKNIDVGCFLKVTGTVVRVTQSKMLEYRRVYVCVKCKLETIVEGRFDERYVVKAPSRCPNDCKSPTFTQINSVSREHCKDYQELKIQEQVNKLKIGCIPCSMWVTVEDDLVDCCKPGDDISVCGTVRRRWRPLALGRKCEAELVIQSNHVQVCNTQSARVVAESPDVGSCFDAYWTKFRDCPVRGRDNILAAVCPQEQVNKLKIGCIPCSMWVTVEDDLVDCCKPGDDISVCGTVRRRWRPLALGRKCEAELVIQSNHVQVCNTQSARVVAESPDVGSCFDAYWTKFRDCPVRGRDNILAAVCPQVYGLHLVKLALLLTVVTGSNHLSEEDAQKSSDEQHGVNVRGQCHLLLVGDPGTGKSQLLRAGAELTPRSVFTSGTGSTRAGLTCAALRDEGEWQLEAGALVLSDGGVCCIDEIGQLREHDRTSIHEAMEQQTISIAKAGIVCKLNTRCSVIGACNPKGHYQTDQPLSANVSLGTPLLSRFDLIFILLDTKNEEWDKLVSSYILFGSNADSGTSRNQTWSIEKLQMYISTVAARRTAMSKSAHTVLQTYYMRQRGAQHRDVSRTTVRTLDSLVRLSQAHCRLMYRDRVLTMDAVTAVSLVDLSMQDCTLRGTTDALHSTIPKHPDYQYLLTAKRLLTCMNLYEIWNEELLYYSKLLNVDHKTLESEIDKESYKLFVKYDNVADENVPLSCSIVTSSYFRKQEKELEKTEQKKAVEVEDKCKIDLKLAETLKKHSVMNKVQPIPNIKNVKAKKRKAIDGNLNKRTNRNKKQTRKRKINEIDDSESDENFDSVNILNNVPSVNDIFADLGMNLNYGDETPENNLLVIEKTPPAVSIEQNCMSEVKENLLEIKENKLKQFTYIQTREKTPPAETIEENCNLDMNKDNSMSEVKENVLEVKGNKLKQFQFIQKRDLSKFYDESTSKKKGVAANKTNSKQVEVEAIIKSNSVQSHRSQGSGTSSQISIFESSDCDLDLEL